jgi:hypothetical protein
MRKPVSKSVQLPSCSERRPGTVSGMAPDRPSLFLLEHKYERAAEADLVRVHRALTSAVRRLVRGGTHLRIVSAVFVPDQARCLYLVEAAVAGQVVEATDVAGLLNGMVHRVVRLDDMSQP